MVWNQRGMEVEDVVMSANVVLSQWYGAKDKSFDHFLGMINKEDGDEQWVLPTVNKIKVNTNAAIFEASGCYSFAFVVRNHEGKLVEARSRCCSGNISPEIAEAMGIREALSWTKEQDRTGVVVETDCLVAVQAIRGPSILLSYFGITIEDCGVLLEEVRGKEVSVKFIKRSANNVAHSIARYSSSIADRIWTMDNVHPEFINVMLNDLK
ncbi:uncharacterized protein LOC141683598 [Apium graveolens]|uniref:uncharacterized protein LOC141683598 n=1 Tax=Apium graveolens TaxID=4045 RepID=UPI003D7A2CA6